MTPLTNGTVSQRTDIAGAFFDLDSSSVGPISAGKKPRPFGQIPEATFDSPTADNTKREQKITLLTLPFEIRLQIYELLLVNWVDRVKYPLWAVRNTYQRKVSLHDIPTPQGMTMKPSILQTCKQIYHEANGILYSRNTFFWQPGTNVSTHYTGWTCEYETDQVIGYFGIV